MIRCALIGLLLGLIASLGALALRQGPKSNLELSFRNSVTGEAVVPHAIWVESVDKDGSNFVTTVKADSYGRATVALSPGTYRVSTAADEFGTHSAETLVGKTTPELIFNFDPMLLPKEAEVDAIRRLLRKDAFLVTGFVVDDETGRPVPGLKVGNSTTKPNGWFATYLPLTGNPQLAVSGGDYARTTYANFETWPSGDIQLRVRMSRSHAQEIDLLKERRRGNDDPMEHPDCTDCSANPTSPGETPRGAVGPALPKSLRVGRNCPTSTTCSSVEVYSLQTYAARVLSSEWYGCWGSVAGGMDAMRAGAVAVRSYGAYHAYNPRTSTYDICDTTSCQVFGTTTNTNSQTATNETNRYVLTTSTGAIARSEYSAENNDSGCGDGFTGTGTSGAPCIADPVCTGFAMFGHGRGLCQWGSARWATGKVLSSGQACTSSAPNTGQPTKNWLEIIAHYYTSYNLVVGAEITLNSITSNPASIIPGGSTQLTYNLSSSADVNNVWLIATLSLSGTGTPVTNVGNQLRVNIATGAQTKQRTFATSSGITPGPYSVLGALHFDRDGSNTFNTGDFLMADGAYPNALTVVAGNEPSALTALDATGRAGSTVQLRAVLRDATGTPLPGRTVSFTVNGVATGSISTTSHGLAVINYAIPAAQGAAALPIVASFAGQTPHQPSSATGTLVVTRRP